MLKRLWEGWKVIAHRIGNFQAQLLLSVLYFLMLPPFALAVKIFVDPLHLKHGPAPGPRWIPRAVPGVDLREHARRQF